MVFSLWFFTKIFSTNLTCIPSFERLQKIAGTDTGPYATAHLTSGINAAILLAMDYGLFM